MTLWLSITEAQDRLEELVELVYGDPEQDVRITRDGHVVAVLLSPSCLDLIKQAIAEHAVAKPSKEVGPDDTVSMTASQLCDIIHDAGHAADGDDSAVQRVNAAMDRLGLGSWARF